MLHLQIICFCLSLLRSAYSFAASSFFNYPRLSHNVISLPFSHLLFPPWFLQGVFCRVRRSIKWFIPLELMPKVTSCPTSCLTVLAVYSAGKPQRDQWTSIESSTSCGTMATVYTSTSHSTHICWLQASSQRGGTVAFTGPRSIPMECHSAIF